jgi:hypothetical protein
MTTLSRPHLLAALQAAEQRYAQATIDDARIWLNACHALRDMLAVAS